MWFRALVLGLVLSAPVWAQAPGENPITGITQGNVSVGCGGQLELSPADFSCVCTANGLSCPFSTTVSHLGSCIGEAADFCGTVDFTGKTVTLPTVAAQTAWSVTPSTSPSVSVNTTGTATQIVKAFSQFPGGLTLGANSAFVGTETVPSITLTGNPSGSFWSGIGYGFSPTIANQSGTAVSTQLFSGLYAAPTFRGNTSNLTMADFAGFPVYTALYSAPTFNRSAGTPTISVGTVDAVYATATIDTGVTVAKWAGLDVVDLVGAGTTTLQVGVDIAVLNKGVTKIGIRNASSTVNTPSTAQAITLATNTILCNATVVQVNNTTAGSLTLTSNPTIADGVNGQMCTIVSVSASQNIVLTNGNNLRLPAATNVTLGPADVITLMFNTTLNDWVTVSRSDN